MPTTFKLRGEPDFDQPINAPLAQQVACQAEHVHVIMPATDLGRHRIVAGGGSNTRKLIGRN